METLWVDFNNLGIEGVRLICSGTIDELNRKSIVLKEGLEFLIWMDDADEFGKEDNLVVKAIIKYSDIDGCWVAQFNENELKHQSDV